MVSKLINANPIVYEKKECRARSVPTAMEEYADLNSYYHALILNSHHGNTKKQLGKGIIPSCKIHMVEEETLEGGPKDIKDPKHPYSLEELKVIIEDAIDVDDQQSYVRITFTPTVEHCSMATIIGLCLRVKLLRSLPFHYKVDIRVVPRSHASESAVNKQLNDKERVAAALENPNLVDMVDECLAPSYD
ncbi:hypothetical protein RGQ29_017784 [Quercus rubra]|uniref:MIP18 family-like domain-containing protein n=1 Tax=Quercus rubra TaxID=3512 RepID=A0AAN7FHT3_QUERU|nr:hypothetical protein RGQ29_017784 [Quercus rubra]